MMETLVLTFAVFFLAVLAMIVGVWITGRSLKGSCGGPSCACVAKGEDVLDCTQENGDGASLPMHPGD